MTVSDEHKKKFILNVIYWGLLIAVICLIFKYAAAWLTPFIIGFLFAALANFLSRKLLAKINVPHRIGSVVLNIVVLVVTGFIFYFLAYQMANLIMRFIRNFIINGDLLNQFKTALAALSGKLPENVSNALSSTLTTVANKIVSPLTEWTTHALTSSAPRFLVSFLITIIASFIITADYGHIRAFIVNQFDEKGKKLISELKDVMRDSILRLFRSYLLIMLITITELFIGFTVMKLFGLTELTADALLAVSAATAVIDIIPVLGTGFVLWPWALVSAVNGQYLFALGLIILYVIIQIVRQIIEPRLVGDSLGLHPIVALMAMYVGVKAIGAGGIILFPLAVLIIKALQDRDYISIYRPLPETPKKRLFRRNGSEEGKS